MQRGELPDTLLLLEHPHTYTLGRRGKHSDILASPTELARLGVEVRRADRGGEATYHGPGQLVGYPIVNLRRLGCGVKDYVAGIERALIRALAHFGVDGESGGGRPVGVWAGDAKIAAIGVRVSRGVAAHGFALNVRPDLRYFAHIVPCGMEDGKVTSIAQELTAKASAERESATPELVARELSAARRGAAARRPSVGDAAVVTARKFAAEFGMRLQRGGLDALGDAAPRHDG